MKKLKTSSVFAFLLFALMLIKVSAFHVYAHQDGTSSDIENCTLCDLAIENQSAEYQIPQIASFNVQAISPVLNKPALKKSSPITSIFLYPKLFGRPPPFLA